MNKYGAAARLPPTARLRMDAEIFLACRFNKIFGQPPGRMVNLSPMRILFLLFMVVCLVPQSEAQLMKGRIYDKDSDSALVSVTIFNLSRKLYALSTREGEYAIVAQEGDKVVFSSVGYKPDTVKVLNFMIDAGYDVTMALKNSMLRNVDVHARNYQADSLRRREEYAAFYNQPKNKIVSKQGPQNGVGMAFSPIGFFSRKAKDKKVGKKLQYEEEQDFVNYSFSRRYVEKMTGLRGDSLETFMILYRPSYEFCRSANSEDMLNYVNEKLKVYLGHQDPPAKKKED